MSENKVSRKEKFYDFCKSKNIKKLMLVILLIALITTIFSIFFNIFVLTVISFVAYVLYFLVVSIIDSVSKYDKETYMKNKFMHVVLAKYSTTNWMVYLFVYAVYMVIKSIFTFNPTNEMFIVLLMVVGCTWIAFKISDYFDKRIKRN